MAIIPLKQTVTVKRKGETDRWGIEITPDIEFTLKCRVDEGAKLTRRTSQQPGAVQTLSEEVVSSAQILFDKFTDIRLTDEILYTDESGNTRVYLPINVSRVRGLNGKAVLTEVLV
ncbi:hypothetical protein [Cytobacillus solani]|uniref:Phage protein n=1 Tax=Cytobacillus solani TaxID=1637975 RepID=A0A0Q3QM81_9BACI|nr:hypothetical protein [Cytobacillus solani]KQL18854.1 hypothetical protein AN957_09915 [Cytobacillus solani]